MHLHGFMGIWYVALAAVVVHKLTLLGLITSIFAAGGLLGALLAGPMMKRYGRRRALIVNGLGLAVSGLIKAASMNVTVMSLGRFLSGIGSGAAAVIVPLYLNEVAPRDRRGSFGAFTQISINIGILTTQAAGLGLSMYHHRGAAILK